MADMVKIATRDSYGSALVELGKEHDNLVVFITMAVGWPLVSRAVFIAASIWSKSCPSMAQTLKPKASSLSTMG